MSFFWRGADLLILRSITMIWTWCMRAMSDIAVSHIS